MVLYTSGTLPFVLNVLAPNFFSNGLVAIRAHQFFEWLLFVSVTENLLGKLYVVVGVQMHCCDMQIAVCGLLGKPRQEMAIFFSS